MAYERNIIKWRNTLQQENKMETEQFKLTESEGAIEKELRVDDDGIGWASIRGTARLAGVDRETLRKAFAGDILSSKLAEMLTRAGYQVATFSQTGVPDLAVALIVKYYAWMNGKRCTKIARDNDLAFSAMGVRTWIQRKKGLSINERQLSYQEYIESRIPPIANEWDLTYYPRFWNALEELYGLKQGHRGCASFINAWIYDFFPPEIRKRLDEINPMVDGKRANRQHQHFNDELKQALIKQIETVIDILHVSQTKEEFKRNMGRLQPYQLDATSHLRITEEQ
jgi:hypothetical protein